MEREREMTDPILPSPSLYESRVTTVRFWSFDLFGAPKNFQKCSNTTMALALVSLRGAASPAEVLGEEKSVYLQLKVTKVHGHFTLDAEHKPLHRLPELLRDSANGMDEGHRLAVLKLGPKWYAFVISVDAEWNYDYVLLMRRQYPGEGEPAPYEERQYFIIADDGTLV